MSESQPIEGKIIPGEVSDAILAKRNGIFTAFRDGQQDGESAYRDLLRLYWANSSASDDVRQWIMDETFEICLEADVDTDRTGTIWAEEAARIDY